MKHVEIKRCQLGCGGGDCGFYNIKSNDKAIGEICPNEFGLAGPIRGWHWWSFIEHTHGSAPSFQQAASRVIRAMKG